MSKSDIWTFVHEPKIFDDFIVSDDIKTKLKKVFEEVPNLLLYGKPGIGKGTFIHIFLRATKLDYLWINASDETGIDAMRDKIKSFAMSLGTTRLKVVVLNEADSLTSGPQGAQKMLRQLSEDVHKITRFIFLANYEHLLIPELKSRCQQVIELKNPPGDKIFFFCEKVLKSERVKYKRGTVYNIIKKCYPDIRKTILSLQANTIDGALRSDSVSRSEDIFSEILKTVKRGDLENLRKTLRNNVIDYIGLYSFLFDHVNEFSSPGDAILSIGEHLYRDSSVSIKEINFIHMIVEMIKGNVL